MTNEEAINWLKGIKFELSENSNSVEALDMAIKALEEQRHEI